MDVSQCLHNSFQEFWEGSFLVSRVVSVCERVCKWVCECECVGLGESACEHVC